MLVVRPVGLGQAAYYHHEEGRGAWCGSGSASLDLPEEVDTASLRAVMGGRRPADGELLLRRLPERRRAGFDLIFGAPKSVSLLEQLVPATVRPHFQAAHLLAVDAAVGYLERRATWTRRGGADERIPTTGLVAAAFDHRWSAAGDPHLHTHLVVVNLVKGADGMWSCLDSRALYRHARAASAIFQSSLRHALAHQGLTFSWKMHRHGLADIAGVSRAAIDACSVRHRQVAAALDAGPAGRVERATAAGRTRRLESPGDTEGWQDRAARAGLDKRAAAELAAAAARRTIPIAVMPAERTIEVALAERSQFERQDVVQVMAAVTVQGAGAETLERWADDYLAAAVRVNRTRWTTPGFRHLEERIATLAATGAARTSAGLARAEIVEEVVARRRELSASGHRAVRRLTTGGAGIDLLAPGNFVSQAWVLGAARTAWEASGHQVAVVTRDQRSAARWRAMSAIGPPPPLPAHATVVLVDGADRWPTSELHQVLDDASARNAKVVLVDGGTTPARRVAESPAMESLRSSLRGIDCGAAVPLLAPSSLSPVVRAGRDATVSITSDGRAAADRLVADWHRARAGRHPSPGPTMVALGPEEAEYLNAAARSRLIATGELRGPQINSNGRQFRAGDEVRALRRDVQLGSVTSGTLGVVATVDDTRQQIVIRWPTGDVRIGAAQLTRAPLRHAYATTPHYIRGANPAGVLCLGDPSRIAPRLAPDGIVQVGGFTPPRERPDPLRVLLADIAPTISAAPVPADVNRSLAELYPERDQIADQLRAEVPPDPGPELRRVAEERNAAMARLGQPGVATHIANLDHRHAQLTAAAEYRSGWLEDHRPDLVRWQELTTAISWREEALATAAEIRPSRAVVAELGPPAAPEHGDAPRRAWREAAGVIEAFRERWAIPDQPLRLDDRPRTPDRGREGARRGDELRVLEGCRAFERSRDHGRGLSPPGL